MRSVLLTAVLASACGCGNAQTVAVEVDREDSPPDLREVQLPMALGAKPRSLSDEAVLFLNVNRDGNIALAPGDVRPDRAKVLTTRAEVVAYLQQRAEKDREAPGPPVQGNPCAVVLLRVDARSRFEKLNAILTAARQTGYAKFCIRVMQPELAVEGEFELGWPTRKDADPPPRRYTLCVTASETGETARVTFRGDTPIARPDHGTDLVALLETMKATAALAERERRNVTLAIEVDPQLTHSHLVQVLDVSTRAGFQVVWLVPIEQKTP